MAVSGLTADQGTAATSFATASVSPTANALVLLTVSARRQTTNPPQPTISGGGMTTWTLVQAEGYKAGGSTRAAMWTFRSLQASPGTGTITVDFGGGNTMDRCNWSLVQVTGADTTGTNGSAAIVQSAGNTSDPGNTGVTSQFPSVSLAAFGASTNISFGAIGAVGNPSGTTPGTGYTEIHDVVGGATNPLLIETEYQQADASPSADLTVNVAWGAIGIEVKDLTPANTVAPAVTGTEQEGSTLTTGNGTWTNSPTSFSYQWQRDSAGNGSFSNIGSATSSTYVLTSSDAGNKVRCTVTATNASASTAANSNQTGLILGVPVNTVAPTKSGTEFVGQVLTAANGTWLYSPSFSYQWQRDVAGNAVYSNISSATASTYTLVSADSGNKVRCVVTGTNAAGAAAANTTATGIIGALPANTVAPAVTGLAAKGSTLTTTDGTWTGSPTFAYQWQRDNSGGGSYSNIASATASTRVLASADVGCNVRCVVTGTNAGGSTAANSNTTKIVDLTSGVVYSGSLALDVYSPGVGTGLSMIVLAHGGGFTSGSKTAANIPETAVVFAQLGFLVLSIDYTLEQVGQQSPNNRQTMIDDIATAVVWARTNAATYSGDGTKVAVLGLSAGAHLGLMVACTKTGTSKPEAVVAWSPPTRLYNLTSVGLTAAKDYLDNTDPVGSLALWQQFSPYDQVTSACPPVRVTGSASEDVTAGGIAQAQYDDWQTVALAATVDSTERILAGTTHANFRDVDGTQTATWLATKLSTDDGASASDFGGTVAVPSHRVLAATGSSGSNTHSALQLSAENGQLACQFIVEAAGAGATVTWKVQGSHDNSNWYDLLYLTPSSDTAISTALVSTATGAKLVFTSNSPVRAYRFYRLVTSANTNVTYSAAAYACWR